MLQVVVASTAAMQHVYGPLALVTLAFSLQGRYEFRQVAYSESAMDWTCLSGVRCLAFWNSGVGTGLLPAYRLQILLGFFISTAELAMDWTFQC